MCGWTVGERLQGFSEDLGALSSAMTDTVGRRLIFGSQTICRREGTTLASDYLAANGLPKDYQRELSGMASKWAQVAFDEMLRVPQAEFAPRYDWDESVDVTPKFHALIASEKHATEVEKLAICLNLLEPEERQAAFLHLLGVGKTIRLDLADSGKEEKDAGEGANGLSVFLERNKDYFAQTMHISGARVQSILREVSADFTALVGGSITDAGAFSQLASLAYGRLGGLDFMKVPTPNDFFMHTFERYQKDKKRIIAYHSQPTPAISSETKERFETLLREQSQTIGIVSTARYQTAIAVAIWSVYGWMVGESIDGELENDDIKLRSTVLWGTLRSLIYRGELILRQREVDAVVNTVCEAHNLPASREELRRLALQHAASTFSTWSDHTQKFEYSYGWSNADNHQGSASDFFKLLREGRNMHKTRRRGNR